MFRRPLSSRAGTVESWSGSDSYLKYLENLRKWPDKMSHFGWTGLQTLTYSYNEEGFRSDVFDDRPGMMFLGCSLTLGTGLFFEQTWPYLVSRSLGLACWNLAVGGGANDTIFRLARQYISRLQPKLVVAVPAQASRFEVLEGDERFTVLMANATRNLGIGYQEFYRRWIDDDQNSQLNKDKNIMATAHICHQHNIPFLEFDSDYMVSQPEGPDYYADLARDLSHPGPATVAKFAELVLEKINDKIKF